MHPWRPIRSACAAPFSHTPVISVVAESLPDQLVAVTPAIQRCGRARCSVRPTLFIDDSPSAEISIGLPLSSTDGRGFCLRQRHNASLFLAVNASLSPPQVKHTGRKRHGAHCMLPTDLLNRRRFCAITLRIGFGTLSVMEGTL